MRKLLLSLLLFLPFAYGWAENASQDTSKSLFNSCWRNEQTGDWQLSLFDSCAIYDSKMWKYATKTEKKVVLTDGNTKVNIEIGKNKNGKSDFVIDGKKMQLSQITTEHLPDYPTADSTAFSTVIKPGEATIVGYLKDIPEEYSWGKIYLKVNTVNYVGAIKDEKSVVVDKDGKFKITVPLFGVNMAHLNFTNGNQTIAWMPMVLDYGKTYFLLHDFSNKQSLFMGEDARLQNEFQGKWNVVDFYFAQPKHLSPEKMIEHYHRIAAMYPNTIEKVQNTINEHPTISKRYRDFTLVASRYAICNLMLFAIPNKGILPDEIYEWISKYGYLDTTMPLTLTEKIALAQDMRIIFESQKIEKRYHLTYEDLLTRAESGRVKLSDDDIELIKLLIASSKEQDAADEIEDPAERRFALEALEAKYPIRELINFYKRHDIDSIMNNGAPSQYEIGKMVVDSLYKGKKEYDFALSLWLMRNMSIADEGLPKELHRYISEVRDTFLVNKIYERHYRLANAANQKFPEVEASARPSSDVKGLTDGKAILEKILEPFKGRFVHIDFWGTWCGGCMQQMQHTPMLKSELKDYDMVYLYFANNSKYADWIRKINDLNVYGRNCVHYNLPKEQENALETYLNVIAYPAYFLVDKQGNIHNLGNSLSESIPEAKRIMEK